MTKTALITGSGRNIGRSCALQLAEDGINVAVNGSSDRAACEAVAKEVEALGVKSTVVMGNVGDNAMLKEIYEKTVADLGNVDILINNAAVRPNSPFLETDEAEWDKVMNIDFNSGRHLAKLCLPHMVEQGWGRIVNFSGMNAIQGYPGKAIVTVAKHASWGLVKSLAKEFGKDGITTNMISPGPIESEADEETKQHIGAMVGRIPLGRLGKPDEVAAMVRLLVSEQGAFINGQMLQVNGGADAR
jgi:3-oxoacyl-[acyl-carrier protein] reductase